MQNNLKDISETFTQTHLWVDAFSKADHLEGLANGCVGITTSPTWVSHMVLEEPQQEKKMQSLLESHPYSSEQELLWMLTLENARERSKVLLDIWEKGKPGQGRFAVQTSIYDYNNKQKMVKMALDVDKLGPNMQVKIPATKEGIAAMEEATYLGVSVMATLCFSVDQAVAAAEAVKRGLNRRAREGKENSSIAPVCAVLLGMQEDWLHGYMEKEQLAIDPCALCYAGVAITKKIHALFAQRHYPMRVLTAYYRHLLHFREFIGGDLIMTIPIRWQRRFVSCALELRDFMHDPVAPQYLDALCSLAPFAAAYTQGSLADTDFDTFGPVVMTLRYFTESYEKAILKIRQMRLRDPLA